MSSLLQDFMVNKEKKIVAISTPIPGHNNQVSKKTPVFHLPVYKINLQMKDQDEPIEFHCDLADMIDIIDKLKGYENQLKQFGDSDRL